MIYVSTLLLLIDAMWDVVQRCFWGFVGKTFQQEEKSVVIDTVKGTAKRTWNKINIILFISGHW